MNLSPPGLVRLGGLPGSQIFTCAPSALDCSQCFDVVGKKSVSDCASQLAAWDAQTPLPLQTSAEVQCHSHTARSACG